MPKPPVVSFVLDVNTKKRVASLAKQTGLSQSLIAREALNYLCDHPELLGETLAAKRRLSRESNQVVRDSAEKAVRS